MVIASYTGCNKTLVVVSFTLSLFTMGPYYAGQKLTPLDMSPSFSGTIMAITNGLGSFAGLFSPYIVGVMTPNVSGIRLKLTYQISFLNKILYFSPIAGYNE